MYENKAPKYIKDFKLALKDFEPMVKEVTPLINGRDISNFSLRPREAWANWLLCVVLSKVLNRDITFAEDEEGDGVIFDRGTGEFINTEHVSALENPKGTPLSKGSQRVISAIDHKINEGPEYATGKTLVVFFDGAGEFFRKEVREGIAGRHNFDAVYAIGLLWSNESGYAYSVTEFQKDVSHTFKVVINQDFTSWDIYKIVDTVTTFPDGSSVEGTKDLSL